MSSKSDDVMQVSLAASSTEAAHSFERLCSLFNDAECEGRSALTKHEAEDQSIRFRLWAGNIGAFHRLPSTASLDYRLRESPNVAIQIQEHLEDLKDCLNTVCSIASGERPNRPIDSDDEDEQEDYEDFDGSDVRKFYTDDPHESIAVSSTEAEESFGTAKDTITGLFRLSILIRKYTPRDRFSRALSGPNPFDETFDIAHVSQKFPKLDQAPYAWLKLRLGRAITQRRRYLQYAREHRQKLGQGFEASEISSIPIQPPSLAPKQLNLPLRSEAGVTRTSGRPSTLAPTNASTLLLPSSTTPDKDLEDSQSHTSFAISLGDEDRKEQFSLPTIVDVLNGNETFECPFCWTIQSFRKEATWRKHVLADLRPYICTFENCDLKLFSHRQSWFDHELSHHRRTWHCPFCQQRNFQDPDILRRHLERYHLQDEEDYELDTVLGLSTRTVTGIAASECPFCDEWQADLEKLNPKLLSTGITVTPIQFRNHVGTHMQKLALFAIPRGVLSRDDVSEGSVTSARAAGRAPTTSSTTTFVPRVVTDFPSVAIIIVYLHRWMSRRIAANLRLTLHPPTPRLLSDMFPRPNPDLVDDEKLVAIERLFDAHPRVALVGMADVGKTELAREFCYREAARRPQSHIFWISADDRYQRLKSFRAMMKGVNLLGYDDKNDRIDAEMLLRVLDTHVPWILVIDGINRSLIASEEFSSVSLGEESDDGLLLLLSEARGGKVLLTTQSITVAHELVQSSQIVEVEILTEEASISLLRSRLNPESNPDNSDLAELAKIAKYRLVRLFRICEQHDTVHPGIDMKSFVPYIRRFFPESTRHYISPGDFEELKKHRALKVNRSSSRGVSTDGSSGGMTEKAEESEQIHELDSGKAKGEEAK